MMDKLPEEALVVLEKTFKDRIRRPARSDGTGPGSALASVLPLHAEEVEMLSSVADHYSIPLAAEGGGTAPGSVAVGGRLLVRFDLMRGVRLPDHDEGWVEAEPGTPWLQLENRLRLESVSLAVYPTSAPRATVGGWLATDGLGVGSFEYGRLRENVLSASVVLPGCERREVPGEEIGAFLAPGSTEGIIVGARLRTRRADADVPFAAGFDTIPDLAGTVTDLVEAKVPLWHLAILNPVMARARSLGEDYLIFGAYPWERRAEVEEGLRGVVESRRGHSFPAADAYRAWGERFFPIRPSILPPRFPGVSREFVSLTELPEKLKGAEDRTSEVAVQGSVARSGEVLLLAVDAGELGRAS